MAIPQDKLLADFASLKNELHTLKQERCKKPRGRRSKSESPMRAARKKHTTLSHHLDETSYSQPSGTACAPWVMGLRAESPWKEDLELPRIDLRGRKKKSLVVHEWAGAISLESPNFPAASGVGVGCGLRIPPCQACEFCLASLLRKGGKGQSKARTSEADAANATNASNATNTTQPSPEPSEMALCDHMI